MRSLVRHLQLAFSQAQNIPLTLSYPFQYTLALEEFTLQDVRFKELPFSRQFANPEKEHIQQTLQHFQKLLNTGKSSSLQYLHKSLIDKSMEVREILAESKIKLDFKINTETVSKSQGYLQIRPQDGLSLQQKVDFIHNYGFQREGETLKVSLRPQRSKMTAEEQLKKDIADKMGEKSKQFRQKLEQMRFSKEAIFLNRFMDKLMSYGKRKPTSRFQSYFIIDQVQGLMNCTMSYEGQVFEGQQLQFDTKWLYWVDHLQSDDLRKHRKRTLFDFQYWNRGNFFPIRNYAAEISHL